MERKKLKEILEEKGTETCLLARCQPKAKQANFEQNILDEGE